MKTAASAMSIAGESAQDVTNKPSDSANRPMTNKAIDTKRIAQWPIPFLCEVQAAARMASDGSRDTYFGLLDSGGELGPSSPSDARAVKTFARSLTASARATESTNDVSSPRARPWQNQIRLGSAPSTRTRPGLLNRVGDPVNGSTPSR
jgi:hypothetical protein